MRYKYLGKTKIILIGYGEVNPGDEIEINFEINNKDFKKIDKKEIKNYNKK